MYQNIFMNAAKKILNNTSIPDSFIDSTHMKLFQVISSGCNALVAPFQQLLKGSMEVLLCERVHNLRHSLFHLFNCLITTASELKE